jgi:hypothetical protein
VSYEEVELKKKRKRNFGPRSIFRICLMDENLYVKTKLVDF